MRPVARFCDQIAEKRGQHRANHRAGTRWVDDGFKLGISQATKGRC